MTAEKKPAGNPKKIEKKIIEERISVTKIVTMINVMIESKIEIKKILRLFILFKKIKKRKKVFGKYSAIFLLIIDAKSCNHSRDKNESKFIWFGHVQEISRSERNVF